MIVLDTHAVVWVRAHPERVPPRARTAIEASDELAISDISLWELAMLAAKRRILVQPERSIGRFLSDVASSVRVLSVTASVAEAVAALPDTFPTRDPADQIIYATATVHGADLVSADRRLRTYDAAVIWS